MGSARRLRLHRFGGTGGAVRLARIGGLVALLWATSSEHHLDGSPRVPVALLLVTSAAWLAWLAGERLGASVPVTWMALAVLAAGGGAVGGLAPVGIAFPAIAVIATATLADGLPTLVTTLVTTLIPTLVVAALGVVSLAITVLAAGSPKAIIVEGLLAVGAAILGGATRRQYRSRAAQAEQLLAERVRADAEQARAAALAERNRVAREVHDVLAHSLGALSVQLEAADALLESPGDPATAREYVQHARRLAVAGLAETRTAVRALREEPVGLGERLAALASSNEAELEVTGAERRLAADVELALYRAAQEALSNARKHAPGSAVSVHLDYGSEAMALLVENGPCPDGRAASPLGVTGGGYGLRGMRERIELLGGEVSAAAQETGWMVRATVPV
jgi:signal transduction histidine kinase